MQLFQAGRLAEAERIMRGVLKRSPRHPGALQTAGMIAARQGDLERAERLLKQCVEAAPGQAGAHINLANLLLARAKPKAAERSYRRALNLAPQLPVAHYNLGRCLSALGQPEAAAEAYRQALALQPDFVEAGLNLAALLAEREGWSEAEQLYRDLLQRHPRRPEIAVHFGDLLRQLGRGAEACAQYRAVLDDHPGQGRATLGLGLALLDEQALGEAAALLESLKEGPGLARHERLAAQAALRARQGDRARAVQLLGEAIRAGADRPQNHLLLATWLTELRQRDQALQVLEASLARFGERPSGLLGQLVVNQRHLCAWQQWEARSGALVERIRAGQPVNVSPFVALSLPGLSAADQQRVARAHAERLRFWSARAGELRRPAARLPGERLRIGYLSADFHEHATAYLTAALFERHDRARFEVFAYSWGPDDASPMRRRLHAAFEHFVEIGGLSHLQAAQRISDDGIDILVDLKGYTRDARTEILALRPSPIQVNWLGYPGTLGAAFIDYIVVDPVVVPEEQAAAFDEQLAYLPHAYAPVDDRRAIAPIPRRAEVGLPEDAFVFCCFNNPYKITPELFSRWCRLLDACPGAVLWLFANTPLVEGNLRAEARARGIDPERLIFAPRVPQAEHLARLALADLCLDTLPYNAHTTASDALWVGVPMLTCIGETFPGRVAASLLKAAGLPELITRSLDDYEAEARRLAQHPEILSGLRQRLAEARTRPAPFFDGEAFARHLEGLYATMWERHRQGLAPAPCRAAP